MATFKPKQAKNKQKSPTIMEQVLEKVALYKSSL